MNSSLILAIDQGGQSTRVGIYSVQGELLHCFSSPCATQHYRVDGVEFIEQKPLDILLGLQSCLAKVQSALGERVRDIVAAGFAGQGSSMLCWNSNTGEALTPVLSWQDIRGKDYLNAISLTQEQAQSITGLRISPHYGASKIRWCLEHHQQVQQSYQRGELKLGPIVSYLFHHLCHQTSVDPGHAQRTLLWSLHSHQWDTHLLSIFGVDSSVLPESKYHNSDFGQLTLGNSGASIRISMKASARDQGASLFARGMPDKKACYVNIGTGAFIQRVSESLSAPDGLLVSPLWIPQPHSVQSLIDVSSPTCYDAITVSQKENSLYAWEATVNGAASAISFIESQTGLSITPELINQALSLRAESNIYFLNAVGGLSAPYWRTDLTSRFSDSLSPHEKVLAWLESIIFQIVVNIELMEPLGSLDVIYISGGISRADGICQRLADLTGAKIARSENTDATLQGIAYMASGFSESWSPLASDEIFLPRENPALLARYSAWQSAMSNWLM